MSNGLLLGKLLLPAMPLPPLPVLKPLPVPDRSGSLTARLPPEVLPFRGTVLPETPRGSMPGAANPPCSSRGAPPSSSRGENIPSAGRAASGSGAGAAAVGAVAALGGGGYFGAALGGGACLGGGLSLGGGLF